MPSYKDKVKKNIPIRLHTQDFNVLLKYISQNKITNTEKLKTFLDVRQGKLQTILNQHKAKVPQSSSHLRKRAIELDWIKRMKKTFLPYL